SPLFVTLLALALFAVALSLSGVIVIGSRWSGAGQALAGRAGYAGSFFTGALATVAATPCTAPFMGVAVGYAVTQPWLTSLLVFEALGLGLALPFLLLTLVPAWRRLLPAPGPWMTRVQQLLAFPLYASVAWLVWVVSQQAGPPGVAAALAGLVLIAFAAWLHGLVRDSAGLRRRVTSVIALALVVAAVALGAIANPGSAARTPGSAATKSDGWEPFSPARLAELRAARTPAVEDVFARKGVVMLKADWTRRDPVITQVLGTFGRNGVPLYLLYPAGGATREPAVLPQILSERILIDATKEVL